MGYEDMKVSELRALCLEKGIDTSTMLEKGDFVWALRQSNKPTNNPRSTKSSTTTSNAGRISPLKPKQVSRAKTTSTGTAIRTPNRTTSANRRHTAPAQTQLKTPTRAASTSPTRPRPSLTSTNIRRNTSIPKTTPEHPKPRNPPRNGSFTTSYLAPPTLEGMAKFMDDLLGTGYSDTAEFEQAVRRCIPSHFVLISSQDDRTQAQEDFYAIDHYKLGKYVPKFVQKANAGSVATCALLQLMYEDPNLFVAGNLKPGQQPWDCLQISREIKRRVKDASRLEAKPTISSSRPLGPVRIEKAPPFYIVPPGYTGTRRALLIGVVRGDQPDLKGPPNDCANIRQFLQRHCGFKPENITVLQDYHYTDSSNNSTKRNILNGFESLVKKSKAKDVCFIQFSGHGGRTGNNLFILPTDYDTAGQIMDEVILRDLIKKMPANVYTTMLVDCCYSGTVGDLPYVLQHNTLGRQKIDKYYDMDMRKEMLKKEAEGGENYQLYKQARSNQRLTGRLTEVADFAVASAMWGYDATAKAAQAGYDVTVKAAQQGYDTTAKMAQQGYDAAATAAHASYEVAQTGYDVTAKAAYAGYDATAKTAEEAAVYTSRMAEEAGKQAATALKATSESANKVALRAASALRFPSQVPRQGNTTKTNKKTNADKGASNFGISTTLADAATSAASAASAAGTTLRRTMSGDKLGDGVTRLRRTLSGDRLTSSVTRLRRTLSGDALNK